MTPRDSSRVVPRAHSWTPRARDGDAIGLDRAPRARVPSSCIYSFARSVVALETGIHSGRRRARRSARSIASSLRARAVAAGHRFDPARAITRANDRGGAGTIEGREEKRKKRKRARTVVRRCGRGWTRAGWGRDGREGRSRRRGAAAAAAAARRTIQTARGRPRRRWDGW